MIKVGKLMNESVSGSLAKALNQTDKKFKNALL